MVVSYTDCTECITNRVPSSYLHQVLCFCPVLNYLVDQVMLLQALAELCSCRSICDCIRRGHCQGDQENCGCHWCRGSEGEHVPLCISLKYG